MATKAKKVWGGTVVFDGVTITEITTFGKGQSKREIIEVFSCDSTSEAVEKISSGLNNADITFGRIFDGDVAGCYNSLKTKYDADTSGSLVLTIPAGGTFTATARIDMLETPGGPARGGVHEHDISFSISGSWVFVGV